MNLLLVVGSAIYLSWAVNRRRKQAAFHLKLITILTSSVAIRELLERVAVEIQSAASASNVFFFVYKPDGHFVSSGTKGHLRPTASDCHMLESYFYRTGRTSARMHSLHDEAEIRRLLKGYRVDFAMPLINGSSIIGFLFLGPKKSGLYTSYDIGMVFDIKHELAIALQNAASLEAMKELNAHLQQRIDSATDELRTSNEQLRGLDTAKDEFVSMASHQLRTPLTSVKGYISMVLEGDAGKITKLQKQFLREALTSSERMVHLINDFLNVSRVQTGKFMIERHSVDLAKVLKQEIRSLETTAESRDLRLKLELPKDPVVMMVDEGKLRQVIMNFIDNALYYSRPDTDIRVKLSILRGDVRVEVVDNGIGVPAHQQAQLFSKFFRADNARTQRPDGTGVGLYLAKMVIDGHGGKLLFSSKEGKGSTFGFTLPLQQPNDTDSQ
ncbi:HAMP domain-containing histidine kinase [Candidatus Saccharibacteria bacterium]|nr:HAMP domain-containing histidine kinase [Candidatus Saccharibacteria bacterium]